MTDLMERYENELALREPMDFQEWYNAPEGTPLPANLTLDRAMVWGGRFRPKWSKMQWKTLEFIQDCRRLFGESYVQIAEETGLSPDRLKVMLSTGDAARVTRQNLLLSRPDTANVPFSFFEAIAPDHIPQEDKERLIVEGMEAGLSRDNFREYVKSECPNPNRPERSQRRPGGAETGGCLDTLSVEARGHLAHLRRYWRLESDGETIEKALAATVRSYSHKETFRRCAK